MKKLLLILCIGAFSTTVNAQKIKVTDGDLSALSGVKAFNVVYDYSDMAVGKFDKEEDYVNKKVKEYNEKEAGRGDKWKESWINDRESRFEPKFEELFTKYSKGIELENEGDNAVIMTVHTVFTEPGFNVGVVKKPSEINLDITFTDEDGNVICKMTCYRAPGSSFAGMDYDTGARISESYAIAGKKLGKYIYKKTK